MAGLWGELIKVRFLLPYSAIALGLLAIVTWAAKQFFGKLLTNLAGAFSGAVADRFRGGGSLTGHHLFSYRAAIKRNYVTHALGFERRVIDIRKVYIPLTYRLEDRPQDVYARIRSEPRSVVLGAAGAGKSLLLKNSLLLWAERPAGRVPVMVDLHEWSGNGSDLVDLVARVFRRNGLHRCGRPFVERALREGRLSLLLDGFDEVSRDDQDRVSRELRGFADTWGDCQMVVTCREAVYRGQLAPKFDVVVQIAPLDDAAMRRLLANWPGIDRAGGVDQLFARLRDSPQIMQLARNPLLLTMIAYLCTDEFPETEQTLPGSRSDFYNLAVTHLLDRDRTMSRPNVLYKYQRVEKLSVLERLALDMQDAASADDRKLIRHQRVLDVINHVLPDLNRGAEHALPILDEVTSRSDLLFTVDRGEKLYQFRHLTLQEYLAARELADDPDRLLERYRRDPDAWRETVKLWCGASERDCTRIVRATFDASELQERVLALECLAEAKRIDDVFANVVIEHFAGQLGTPGRDGDLVVAALGAVAADSRPRARRVLHLLEEAAGDHDEVRRGAAQWALAASGRREAAERLAILANDDSRARAALRAMGELTLPVLASAAQAGRTWAVDDIASIATPAAAEALAGLLWTDDATATRAAWRLAGLTNDATVAQGLRTCEVVVNPVASRHDWMWRPFARPGDGPLGEIMARVAYLIDTGPAAVVPNDLEEIDSRVGIPIGVLGAARLGGIPGDAAAWGWLPGWVRWVFGTGARRRLESAALGGSVERPYRQLRKALLPEGESADRQYSYDRVNREQVAEVLDATRGASSQTLQLAGRLADSLMDAANVEDRYQDVIRRLAWPVQAEVLKLLFARAGVEVGRADWLAVREPRTSDFVTITLIIGIMAIVGLGAPAFAIYRDVRTIAGSWPWGPTWLAWLSLVVFAVTLVAVLLGLWEETDNGFAVSAYVVCLLYSLLMVLSTAIAWMGGWPTAVAAFAIVATFLVAAVVQEGIDKANANPLRAPLAADARVAGGSTSVVAGSPPTSAPRAQ